MVRVAVFLSTISAALLGAFAVSPVQTRGEESAVQAEIRSMFAAGWKPSLKGLKDAERHYDQAKTQSPNDVRVPFAMALLYLQNRKYNESVRELDAALAGGKALLPIRRTRIYVAMLMKDQAAADPEVRALATRLSGPELSGDPELPYLDSARFLGSVVEFIAIQKGPESRPRCWMLISSQAS